MNILTDQLPTSLIINNTEYQINSDFRPCLGIMFAFEDNELVKWEKLRVLFENLFLEIPSDTVSGSKEAMRFLSGGETLNGSNQQSYFSFAKDSKLIYSAFRKVFNIDLTTVDLHWWIFRSMLIDLFGEDTAFGNLVRLRQLVKTGKATKEEREAANQMGEIFDLPEIDERTLEEKEVLADFERKLAQAQTRHNGSV